MNEKQQLSDHDLLIRINIKLDELKLDFENHLTDHKKYMAMAWSTAVGLIATLSVLLIKLL